MIKFKEVKGLALENTENLQKIVRTDDGKAIGHIPGWKYFIDPDYTDGVSVRNRALSGSLGISNKENGVINVGGKNFFDLSTATRLTAPTNVYFNPTEYTIFAVIDFTGANQTTYPNWIIKAESEATDVLNVPNFSVSVGGNQATIYSQVQSLGFTEMDKYAIAKFTIKNVKSSKLSLLILSFSTTNGFTLSQDGVVIGTIAHFTPLQNDLNNFSSLRNTRGIAGDLGIFDIDLHKPENTVYRKQLEAHLMKKYSIT